MYAQEIVCAVYTCTGRNTKMFAAIENTQIDAEANRRRSQDRYWTPGGMSCAKFGTDLPVP